MTAPDYLKSVLPPDTFAAWEPMSHIAHKVKGRLIGGTAIAAHLLHRESIDIDISTNRPFKARALEKYLRKSGFAIEDLTLNEDNMFRCTVNNVKVDIFRSIPLAFGAYPPRWIEPPIAIGNMPVAAPSDLMACKLSAIQSRPQARDIIDIAELDRSGKCTLESGIVYYCKRLALGYEHRSLRHMLSRLEDVEGFVIADERDDQAQFEKAALHLAQRLPQLNDYLTDLRSRSEALALKRMLAVDRAAIAAGQSPTGYCGKWMPRAHTRCKRIPGHPDGCRSNP